MISLFLNKKDLDLQVFDEVLQKIDNKMKLQEKNKAVAYGSFPSDQREKFKKNNKEKIMNHPRFQMAVNIYNKF